MKHKYYVVVYKRPGIGEPQYVQTEESLLEMIKTCLENEWPFHVGHEFRMTLNDGVEQNA